MNTRFCYLYRDACNYKSFNEIIISGALDLKHLLPFLKDKIFFIPSEVGLDNLQPEEWTENDHIWHEFENIQLTVDIPTINIDATLFLKKFRSAYENEWNEFAHIKG
jgi:hypothetical protein